ncbi:MAG: hypothetical protein M1829_003537 [Trizodia sp. TS-e1964]|nr:MAG: hypothetical protein M1829_003537 [Trizodia sp. TS-e1964]
MLAPRALPGNSQDRKPEPTIREKDPTEIELENILFGNQEGFLDALKTHGRGGSDASSSSHEDSANSDADSVNEKAEELSEFEGFDDAQLFFLDGTPSTAFDKGDAAASQKNDLSMGENGVSAATDKDEPVWQDSDDDRIAISLTSNTQLRKLRTTGVEDMVRGRDYVRRLQQQFQRLHPVPAWALEPANEKKKRPKKKSQSRDSSDEDDSIDSGQLSAQPLAKLLQSMESLTAEVGTVRRLRPEVIDIQRTKDVGGTQRSSISSLSFHPLYPILLSCGLASTLYLHHISPKSYPTPNPLLTSIHARSTPLTMATFHSIANDPSRDRIFFSGRRRYFHVWNLESGRIDKISRVYGHQDEQRTMETFKLSPCCRWMGLLGSSRKGGGVVNILDSTTLQWIAQARMESRGGLIDFVWWHNGEGLCIAGKGGDIGEWSLADQRFVGKWRDDGAVSISAIGLGGKLDRWIAIGSSNGIVNIYGRHSWSLHSPSDQIQVPEFPKPLRTFDQLATSVSHLVFSPDGQILAMGSRSARDALRLSEVFQSVFLIPN